MYIVLIALSVTACVTYIILGIVPFRSSYRGERGSLLYNIPFTLSLLMVVTLVFSLNGKDLRTVQNSETSNNIQHRPASIIRPISDEAEPSEVFRCGPVFWMIKPENIELKSDWRRMALNAPRNGNIKRLILADAVPDFNYNIAKYPYVFIITAVVLTLTASGLLIHRRKRKDGIMTKLGSTGSNKYNSRFLESIHQPVLIIDRSHKIVSINKQALSIFDRSRKQVMGKPLSEIITGNGIEGDGELSLSHSHSGRNSFPALCKKPNGKCIDCLLTFSRFFDDMGKDMGYIIALTDWGWLGCFAEQKGFTPREIEIARLLIRGETYKKMAEQLNITEATLKTHIHHIYDKSNVENRLQLIEIARGAVGERSEEQ